MQPLVRIICGFVLVAAATADAQAQYEADLSHRAPRFLLVSSGSQTAVPVEPSRAPALLDRISVDLSDATLGEALEAIARQSDIRLMYSSTVAPLKRRVRLRAEDITVAAALTEVLLDTQVDVLITGPGQAVLVRRPEPSKEPIPGEAQAGTIRGRVTDASSGAGISGTTVVVQGTQFDAVTGNTGRYRISDVPAGTYTVVAQQIGYAEARQSVTVSDGDEATTDFALEVSALALDEIVATGTAFETRMRTVPNPISVITAREIEQKQATNISDLLRGEIPGVMALTHGQSDYSSRIYVRGSASWTGGDFIKTYIDGVEVAQSQYLSTIDPKSIDRIEVVSGPQSSAIYGSEASSGVLQIFTKKGRPGLDHPRLDLQASIGTIESDYTPSGVSRPLTQDHSLAVSGGGDAFSYRAGMSYATVGEWLTGYGSSTLGFSGGLRAVQGPLTVELTALWSDRDTHNTDSPIWRRWPASPSCSWCGQPDLVYPDTDLELSQNTIGLTLSYRATERWQHSLTLGDDQNRYAQYQREPHHLTPADTFVTLYNSEFRRRSIRYHTAVETELGESITSRFTAGVDYWSRDVQGSSGLNLLNAFGTVRTSSETTTLFQNDGWWNAGYFGMAELGFRDELFVTLATRVEDNPNLGEEYGHAVSPRIGASFVRHLGAAEVKLRAQWGKGIRPPQASHRAGRDYSSIIYLPNPEIGPEEKVGWDAGIDVYRGSRGSLSLTRFSEEGQNLIQLVNLDLTVVPQIAQYQNIGRVESRGWEVEGNVNVGPVTLQANYAYSDNVIRALSNQYTSNPNSTQQVGDQMEYVPKHSGGGTATWRFGRGSASVNASVIDDWRSLDYIAYYGSLYGGEQSRGPMREYYVNYSDALWKWNLRADQALTKRWAAFVRVDNVTNNQVGDLYNFNVTPGRSTVLGIRLAL